VVARVDALVLRAAQLLGELVDREVEGDELVAVGRLGANDRPLAGHGELDRLVLTGAVVVRTVGDLDIETLHAARDSRCGRTSSATVRNRSDTLTPTPTMLVSILTSLFRSSRSRENLSSPWSLPRYRDAPEMSPAIP
jgi:hypothetical protein